MATKPGELGEVMTANLEIQKICDVVKPQAEQKAGKKFVIFFAKSFASQVVAGTIYFIKVYVGGEEFVHLKVFKSLPHAGQTFRLEGVQTGKRKDETLAYF